MSRAGWPRRSCGHESNARSNAFFRGVAGRRFRAACLISRWSASRALRVQFLRMARAAVRLQRWLSRVLLRRRMGLRKSQAILLQKAWRGSLGRRWVRCRKLQMIRRNSAARTCVRSWRRRVHLRIRVRLGSAMALIADANPGNLEVPGSRGELQAACTSMRRLCSELEMQAARLELRRVGLRRDVDIAEASFLQSVFHYSEGVLRIAGPAGVRGLEAEKSCSRPRLRVFNVLSWGHHAYH